MKYIFSIVFLVIITCVIQAQTIIPLPCFNKRFTVNVHIVRNQAGGPDITEGAIQSNINYLNSVFNPICISFSICSFEYIDNFQYDKFNDDTIKDKLDWLNKNQEEKDLLSKYYVSNTINIYYFNTIYSTNYYEGGYAYMPGGKDVIFLNKSSDVKHLIHQMGHFFGLYHTFETKFGKEQVRRDTSDVDSLNCYKRGDLVCDTYADPYAGSPSITFSPKMNIIDKECHYIGNKWDWYSNFYLPPTDNYMSYYSSFCKTKFTTEQYRRMADQYVKFRSYLW